MLSVFTTVPAARADVAAEVNSAAPSSVRATDLPFQTGVYQVMFPNSVRDIEEYEAQIGRPFGLVHWFAIWGGWKGEFNRQDLETVSRRGSIPLITWEPWASVAKDETWSLRNGVLSGKHDAYIESWARGLAAYGKPVYLRFAHEMHHSMVYPWAVGNNGNTAQDYVAAWRHVRAIFDRHGAQNVKWVWNPQVIGNRPIEEYLSVYGAVYPGHDQVDFVGLDIYNTGTDLPHWGTPYWRPFEEVLTPAYDAVAKLTAEKPILLAEVGSGEAGGSKAEWITRALTQDLQRFPLVRGLVWFDIAKSGELAWTVKSSPGATAAWITANRAIAAGLPGSLSNDASEGAAGT